MKRLITKADRMQVQQYNFARLTEKGYSKEIYNGLTIFTQDDGPQFRLKIFRDTVSEPFYNYWHRSPESRAKAIEEQKKSYDDWQKYKAERKANKTASTAANCASAIRTELKEAFPGVKFSVTSENYSGGNSVRINWTDGPNTDEVESITDKYQQGHFNGMEDIYEYSNRRDDIPQAKYVFASRQMDPETRKALDAATLEICGSDEDARDRMEGNLGYRVWVKASLPLGARVTGLARTKETAVHWEDLYCITYEAPKQPQTKSVTAPDFEPVEVKTGEINIIDYSEKAFAVIGDTKPVKDMLKDLGGKFNAKLSCGPGWIFSKKRLQDVQDRFAKLAEERSKKPFMELLPPDKAAEVREEHAKMENFLNSLSA